MGVRDSFSGLKERLGLERELWRGGLASTTGALYHVVLTIRLPRPEPVSVAAQKYSHPEGGGDGGQANRTRAARVRCAGGAGLVIVPEC